MALLHSQLGYSRTTLHGLFKRELGRSLGRYIADTRLCAAVCAISAGAKIEFVHSVAGFASRSTFYRRFTGRFGTTPAAFLRSMTVRVP